MEKEELLNDLQKLALEDVLLKYNLTFKDLFRLSKELHNYTKKDGSLKYIQNTGSGTFMINKSVNGVNRYFGSYLTEEDAVFVRDKLIDCNWSMSCLDSIVERYNIHKCSKD